MATSRSALQTRLDTERDFHDRRYQDGDNRVTQLKYYWAIEEGAHQFLATTSKLAENANVLEYGCGLHSRAGDLGPICKSFDAIDISEAAVARLRSMHNGPNIDFKVMDAMNLTYPNNSFDLVYGSGIIHHLDVDASAREIARVLRPGGSAFFWEPLGYNPIINAYRWMTPSARTPDEHPLLVRDFDTLRNAFKTVDVTLYGLTSIAAVPLRSTFAGLPMRNILSRIDDVLVRIPGLKYLAWYSIIHCTS